MARGEGDRNSVIDRMNEHELRDFVRFSVRSHEDLSSKLLREYMGYRNKPDYSLVLDEFYGLEEEYKCRWRVLGEGASYSYMGKLTGILGTYIPPMIRGGHGKEAYDLISEMYRGVLRYDLYDEAWTELWYELPRLIDMCIAVGDEEEKRRIKEDLSDIRDGGDCMFTEGGAALWEVLRRLADGPEEEKDIYDWSMDILENERPEGNLLSPVLDCVSEMMRKQGKSEDEIEEFTSSFGPDCC